MVFEIFPFFFFFFLNFFCFKSDKFDFVFEVPLGLFSLRRCLRVPLGDFESERERFRTVGFADRAFKRGKGPW